LFYQSITSFLAGLVYKRLREFSTSFLIRTSLKTCPTSETSVKRAEVKVMRVLSNVILSPLGEESPYRLFPFTSFRVRVTLTITKRSQAIRLDKQLY
jgi:hypothetical protein